MVGQAEFGRIGKAIDWHLSISSTTGASPRLTRGLWLDLDFGPFNEAFPIAVNVLPTCLCSHASGIV